MLRWFVVVLALILGCTEVRDTASLVRIRTGEYLTDHGWLPPRTDVFSYSATDQAWVNLSWLGDLVLAGLFHAGGDRALSIAGGLVAALSFWLLLRASRPGVSTWWNSACAALGLLATFPLLTIGPDAFTVLGLAALMSILARVESDVASRVIWAAPGVLFVWAQLDGHAFLGLLLLLAYAVGHTIDARSESGMVPLGRMWSCVAASGVVMLLHPFHVNTLLAPLSLHSEVYPAHADLSVDSFHSRWLPLTSPEFWETLAVPPVAGLLIASVALVTMLLNAGRLRWSHAVVWLVMNGFAMAAGRQLYAAAVVNVVLSGLNGQDWYRATFRQEYSVETRELIFSRGGRAVTVLGLLALGYLAASGRLMGPDVRRIGIGFDDELKAQIASYRDVLEDSFDNRPFNFRVEQGDLLIWIGQRPFIDSRLGLYTQGHPSLAERYRQIRLALRRANETDPERGKPAVWQEAFAEHHVTHVLPRLTGDVPDYGTFLELMVDPQWQLARLGAATAALYDTRSSESGIRQYLDEHQGADFIRLAFEDVPEDGVLLNQPVWPGQRTAYDELLSKREQPVSNDIQLARHYTTLLRGFRGAITDDQLTALAYLSIRHAWSGLSEHPNAVEGYMALADSYGYLLDIHQVLQQGAGSPGGELLAANDIRQVQAALLKAVDCRPEDKHLRLLLAQFLLSQRKLDLALEQMLAYEQLNGSLAPVPPEDPQYETLLEQSRDTVSRLQDAVQQGREQTEIDLLAGVPRLQVVGQRLSNGLPGEALRVLEEDVTFVAQNVPARLIQAQLLMEVGRGEEAWTQLENMETAIRQNEPGLVNDWMNSTAVANLTAGNFQRAVELWDEQRLQETRSQLQLALGLSAAPGKQPGLGMAPLTYAPAFVLDLKPILQSRLFGDLLLSYPARWDSSQLQKALALLQQGRVEEATSTLSAVLDYDPETELRPPIAFYLNILTGEPQSFVPPSDQIPITGDMFAPDVGHAQESETESSTGDETIREGSDPALPPPPPSSPRGNTT